MLEEIGRELDRRVEGWERIWYIDKALQKIQYRCGEGFITTVTPGQLDKEVVTMVADGIGISERAFLRRGFTPPERRKRSRGRRRRRRGNA